MTSILRPRARNNSEEGMDDSRSVQMNRSSDNAKVGFRKLQVLKILILLIFLLTGIAFGLQFLDPSSKNLQIGVDLEAKLFKMDYILFQLKSINETLKESGISPETFGISTDAFEEDFLKASNLWDQKKVDDKLRDKLEGIMYALLKSIWKAAAEQKFEEKVRESTQIMDGGQNDEIMDILCKYKPEICTTPITIKEVSLVITHDSSFRRLFERIHQKIFAVFRFFASLFQLKNQE